MKLNPFPATLAFLVLIILCAPLFGQKKAAIVFYDKGKALYDDSKYDEAISHFEKSIKMDGSYEDAIYQLGLSYRYVNRNSEAIEQFTALENLNPRYWGWFYYEAGIACDALEKPTEAVLWYDKFLDRYSHAPNKELLHHQAQFKKRYAVARSELLKQENTMKDPIALPDNVNSRYPDYMPASDPTGKIIYFTSKRIGGIKAEDPDAEEGEEDIYMIRFENGAWSDPILLPKPINSENHEGAATFSADGQILVYTACGREEGIGNCDLYIAALDGDKWSTPKNLGNIVNSKWWDSQPTISSDGNRIIFASNREGGYGSEDLYMIERNVFGEWGPPMNLGGMVNTPFSDSSPFLSPDGKTLYFASHGHPGFGSNDIFRSVTENGKWSEPVNMGQPLNTPGNDRYFTITGSGEIGYFASTSLGVSNLYQIEIPEHMRPQPTVIVSGVVVNAKNGGKVGAYVLVEDLNTGELIAVNKSNSVTGKYLIVLPSGRNYSVSANKEAFFFYSQIFEVPAKARYQEIIMDIELKPIEKGAKVVLNNIFFETGKSTLTPDSRLELEKAVELMRNNPTMVIEVGGHTDNVGDDTYNMKLSHDRAKAVREYLVNAGIISDKVMAKGYGETNPIASNDTDDGRQANRRTEFIILEF